MNSNRAILYTIGRFFSPLYCLAMKVRERSYQRGLFKVADPGVPVVSIGNLTLGGTGKTPMTRHLARLLRDHGFRPAVISRGYGGATKEPVNVVSDGSSLLLDARTVGDEPRMLAETLPGVMVLTGVVRRLPAQRAVEMGADVLLLDDGFQHMAVARDLDLVLFNADTLAGNSRVFPGGDLREPVSSLMRCHGFVLTGIDDGNRERAGRFADLLRDRFPGRPVFFTGYRPAGLVAPAPDGGMRAVEDIDLAGEQSLAFCGIARPQSFAATLARMGIEPVEFRGLPDHHGYRRADVDRLLARAEKVGATALVTTEKDLVKLAPFDLPLPLYGVRMAVEPDPELDRRVLMAAGGPAQGEEHQHRVVEDRTV